MHILVVKTSSLGDIIHTLPALSDAAAFNADIRFDWVVEESFAEIPKWHPQLNRVIPIAWRRWRKNLNQAWRQQQLQQFYQQLRLKKYAAIIDAQGLLKSAIIARMAKGLRYGPDYHSAREPLAALFYQHRCTVPFEQHAVTRMRQLFAQALNYRVPDSPPDYQIRPYFAATPAAPQKTLLFIHGTTWSGKEWPETAWISLAHRCVAAGWRVQLPWGNAAEKARAERIASSNPNVQVLPKTSLAELAILLLQAKAAVAVDTGIGHLAAALSVPTLSLYGPTDPVKIGACGDFQFHLRTSLNMAELSTDEVWERLTPLLA